MAGHKEAFTVLATLKTHVKNCEYLKARAPGRACKLASMIQDSQPMVAMALLLLTGNGHHEDMSTTREIAARAAVPFYVHAYHTALDSNAPVECIAEIENYIASAHLDAKEYYESLVYLERIERAIDDIATSDFAPATLVQLAVAKYHLSRFGDAERHLQRIVRHWTAYLNTGRKITVYGYWGMCLFRTERYAEAVEKFAVVEAAANEREGAAQNSFVLQALYTRDKCVAALELANAEFARKTAHAEAAARELLQMEKVEKESTRRRRRRACCAQARVRRVSERRVHARLCAVRHRCVCETCATAVMQEGARECPYRGQAASGAHACLMYRWIY